MKTIFIDRDGVINKDPGGWTQYQYVSEIRDFIFLPGALEALRLLNRNGIRTIIVSNQAGVGKGYFSKKRLDEITHIMLTEIKKAGGNVREVYYCIHRSEDNCACRKPRPGMLEAAMKKYAILPDDAYIIGDSVIDVQAGRSAGLKTIFVLSGKTDMSEARRSKAKPDYVFKDLLEAARWIVKKEQRRSKRATRRNSVIS